MTFAPVCKVPPLEPVHLHSSHCAHGVLAGCNREKFGEGGEAFCRAKIVLANCLTESTFPSPSSYSNRIQILGGGGGGGGGTQVGGWRSQDHPPLYETLTSIAPPINSWIAN